MVESVRVLVVGASGLIGGKVARSFASSGSVVLGTFRSHPLEGLSRLDICNEAETMRIVDDFNPDLIAHAAALTNVDLCETERDSCYRTNVTATQNLVKCARKVGAKLVYFSTDYIFDGNNGPYSEEDPPNPINFYGTCKLEAEKAIRGMDDFLIARTTVVYGWERQEKNFVMNLANRLQRGERVHVPVDQIGTPTYADNLAEAIVDLVDKREKGVFNIAGPDLIDRYTFARMVAEVFQLPQALIVPRKTTDLGQKAARPLNGGLKINKLKLVSSVTMLPPRQGLEIMRNSQGIFYGLR